MGVKSKTFFVSYHDFFVLLKEAKIRTVAVLYDLIDPLFCEKSLARGVAPPFLKITIEEGLLTRTKLARAQATRALPKTS